MTQIKYKLDKETLLKIGRGTLIAATGGAGLYLLSILGAIEISNPLLISFLAWFIPSATNSIREYMKGERVGEVPEKVEPEPVGGVRGELAPPGVDGVGQA